MFRLGTIQTSSTFSLAFPTPESFRPLLSRKCPWHITHDKNSIQNDPTDEQSPLTGKRQSLVDARWQSISIGSTDFKPQANILTPALLRLRHLRWHYESLTTAVIVGNPLQDALPLSAKPNGVNHGGANFAKYYIVAGLVHLLQIFLRTVRKFPIR